MTQPIEDILNIDEVWYINLDRRPDRRHDVEDQIANLPFRNVNRFSAVDASMMTEEQIRELTHPDTYQSVISNKRSFHEEMGRGALGCYLSHVALWKYAFEKKKKLLIMEDDMEFPSQFMSQLAQIKPYLPSKYDIVLLAYSLNDEPKVVNEHLLRPRYFFGNGCYLFDGQCMDRIGPMLFPVRYQIDSTLSLLAPLLDIYAVRPMLATQKVDDKSDAQTANLVEEFLYKPDCPRCFLKWGDIVTPLILILFIVLVVAVYSYMKNRKPS